MNSWPPSIIKAGDKFKLQGRDGIWEVVSITVDCVFICHHEDGGRVQVSFSELRSLD